MPAFRDIRPLVAHVVYRFDVGGLENGVVNLINHMPASAFRHAIISLTEITDFRARITRDDVEFFALNKPPGHGYALFPRMFRLLRELRPAILHTRNLAALEMTAPAWAAGVQVRIHGEHGRDIGDLTGANFPHRLTRRLYRPFVSRYVALSSELASYLHDKVGIPMRQIVRIHNGVDTARFFPSASRAPIRDCPFHEPAHFIFGSVGRMATVKDPLTLARSFVRLRQLEPSLCHTRLAIVGGGPLLDPTREVIGAAGLSDSAWLPGERDDVPDVLRGLDVFVLSSLAEGISNTILEAMATGIPVIATNVGGNSELIEDGRTGVIVPSSDPDALAQQMIRMAKDPRAARMAGEAGRARAVACFSIEYMINQYRALYDTVLGEPELRMLSTRELQ